MGVVGESGLLTTAVCLASLWNTSERETSSQWVSVVCAKSMQNAVAHGNVAPRRDYAMAISAVQSAAKVQHIMQGETGSGPACRRRDFSQKEGMDE